MEAKRQKQLEKIFLFERFNTVIKQFDELPDGERMTNRDGLRAIIMLEEIAMIERDLYGLLIEDDDEETFKALKSINERQQLEAETLWLLKQELFIA